MWSNENATSDTILDIHMFILFKIMVYLNISAELTTNNK